jgi:hypothetical protein
VFGILGFNLALIRLRKNSQEIESRLEASRFFSQANLILDNGLNKLVCMAKKWDKRNSKVWGDRGDRLLIGGDRTANYENSVVRRCWVDRS